MRRAALPLAAALHVGCVVPMLEAHQWGGAVWPLRGGSGVALSTRTAVAAGVIAGQGVGPTARVEVSSGVDGVRGADHRVYALLGVSRQPLTLTERTGCEALAEVGTTTSAFGQSVDVGARAGFDVDPTPRTVARRNRVYDLVLRNLVLVFQLRGGARLERDGSPTGRDVGGYVEFSVGARYRLGSDAF